jgi:hypothetical protein
MALCAKAAASTVDLPPIIPPGRPALDPDSEAGKMGASASEGEDTNRRLSGVPLAWLLIMVASVAIAAQPASEEARAKRTTEIPGSGVGVTLPAEWRIWTFTDDRAHERILASDVPGRRTCAFNLLTDVPSAAAAADETIKALSRHKTEVQRTTHDVPAGTAVCVSYRYESFPDEARFVQHEYYLDVPTGVVSLTCWGDPPAADRWLSVIEAIAPLPADGAVVIPFDPRIEIPENGLAIAFGKEWEVASAAGWPGIVLGGDFVLRARTAGSADCWLEDDTDVPSLADVNSPDGWRTAFIEAVGREQAPFTPLSPGRHVTEPTVADAGLASTNAVRVDWESWGIGSASAWIFLDGERRVVLFCQSEEPPKDRWRSIAETFEFLPAE